SRHCHRSGLCTPGVAQSILRRARDSRRPSPAIRADLNSGALRSRDFDGHDAGHRPVSAFSPGYHRAEPRFASDAAALEGRRPMNVDYPGLLKLVAPETILVVAALLTLLLDLASA